MLGLKDPNTTQLESYVIYKGVCLNLNRTLILTLFRNPISSQLQQRASHARGELFKYVYFSWYQSLSTSNLISKEERVSFSSLLKSCSYKSTPRINSISMAIKKGLDTSTMVNSSPKSLTMNKEVSK